MSEPQTETDVEPTPGPWKVEQGTVISQSERGHIKHIANLLASHPAAMAECDANARLIAAAGTAAQEAADMGYDPVAAVEALPELLEALESIAVEGKKSFPDAESMIRWTLDALDRAEGSDQ